MKKVILTLVLGIAAAAAAQTTNWLDTACQNYKDSAQAWNQCALQVMAGGTSQMPASVQQAGTTAEVAPTPADPECANSTLGKFWVPTGSGGYCASSQAEQARQQKLQQQVEQLLAQQPLQQQAEYQRQLLAQYEHPTSEQLKKLKPSPSDVVGTFEVQGQSISSYSGTGPTNTNCNLNYNTVDCTSWAAQYSIDTLHISGIFRASGMDYVLRIVPLSYRCAFAQGMVAGGGGHAAACGTSLFPGTYVAKLSAGRLRVVSGDGRHKADYTVVEQSIQR